MTEREVEAEIGTERKPQKKHKRRAFLKYAAKIGLGAALWGIGGNLVGKAFKYTVKPVIREGLILYQRSGRRLRNWGILEPARETRRGFLTNLLIKGY